MANGGKNSSSLYTRIRRVRFIIPIASAALTLFAAIFIISMILSVVTAPIEAARGAIASFFSSDNVDDHDDHALYARCIGFTPAELADVMTTVPPGTDPTVARGWILYQLAHPSDQTAPAAAPTSAAPTLDSASNRPDPPIDDIFTFARAWQQLDRPEVSSAPTTAVAPDTADTIPPILHIIDPSTSYDSYVAAGIAATLELDRTDVLTLDDETLDSLYIALTAVCAPDN